MREVASIWSIYLGTIDSSDNLLRAPWWTGEDEACEKTVLRLDCIPFFLMQKWYISFLPVALYSYFFIYGARLRLWTAATNGHTVHPPENMSLKSEGGMILTGKYRRNRRKTCPSATLSTTNPTWIDPGVNLGPRRERPATNRLSHGTARTRGSQKFPDREPNSQSLISLWASRKIYWNFIVFCWKPKIYCNLAIFQHLLQFLLLRFALILPSVDQWDTE
jgi:hypothetical protein